MELVMQQCADAGIQAVPVTSRDRPQEYRDVIPRSITQTGGRAAIRLRDHDLMAGLDGVRAVLRELDLPRDQVDLIFDLQQIDASSTFMLSSTLGQCLERFMPLMSWRSVSVAGSSFPAELAKHVEHDEAGDFKDAGNGASGRWRSQDCRRCAMGTTGS